MATTRSAASSTSSPKNGVGGPPVAIRAEAGAGSFNQRMANRLGRRQFRTVVGIVLWQRHQVRRIPRQQRARPAQRHRQPQLHHARSQRIPDGDRRRPEAGISRRPHRRSLDRRQRTRHRPQGHRHAIRLRQPAGRQRHRWLHQDACGTASTSSSMAACGTRITQSGVLRHGAVCVAVYSFSSTYNDAALQTWSITPRLSVKNAIFGIPSQILTGIDYYDATFHSGTRRVQRRSADPHLRSVAADTGRLLAAHRRPVADDRFLLWRQGSKHQPECPGSVRPQRARLRHVF